MRPIGAELAIYKFVLNGTLEIDRLGRVWRMPNAKTSSLIRCIPRRAEHMAQQGYLQVRVMENGKRIHAEAHRLVWLHFKGEIPPGLTVNHKNGHRSENQPDNLELATYSEQHEHAWRVLRNRRQDGERNPSAKLTEAKALTIRRMRENGATLREISEAVSVSIQQASRIARGDRWAYLG